MGKSNFVEQFRKLINRINRYKRIGYNPYIMRQTACLVVNPIMVDSYFSLFNCTTVVPPFRKAFIRGLGLGALSLAWPAVVN